MVATHTIHTIMYVDQLTLLTSCIHCLRLLSKHESEAKQLVASAAVDCSVEGDWRGQPVASWIGLATSISPKCQSACGHNDKTKQNFELTGFPNASSRTSMGANDEEAPVTLLHFGLPY